MTLNNVQSILWHHQLNILQIWSAVEDHDYISATVLYLTAKQIYTDLTTSDDDETRNMLVRHTDSTCGIVLIPNIEVSSDCGRTVERVATVPKAYSTLQQKQIQVQSVN